MGVDRVDPVLVTFFFFFFLKSDCPGHSFRLNSSWSLVADGVGIWQAKALSLSLPGRNGYGKEKRKRCIREASSYKKGKHVLCWIVGF